MKKVDKTTWKDIINDNEFERFEIEIGDSKQQDFKPQVKLIKWDNECNFSVRAIDNETGEFTPHKVGNKIKLVKNKREYHFYDIPKGKEHPEGGFEFEVILKEKPATNVIEMSIETKGLKFYYQPELTQKEKDEGAIRPENVVGSYAVYHESKQGDYSKMGKKNYRAGKAFHIYRPKIVDRAGNWVWGELNIDEKKGVLSVEIPQEFLDTAVYPIRHAAGLTFGCDPESPGGSTYSNDADYVFGPTATPAEAGTAISISWYLVTGTYDDGPRKFGLYKESDSSLIAQTAEYSGETPDNWITHDFISPSDITAISYVIVHFGAEYSGKYDSVSNAGRYDVEGYDGVFPDPANFSTEDMQWSIYCTYTPSAAGTISPFPSFKRPE